MNKSDNMFLKIISDERFASTFDVIPSKYKSLDEGKRALNPHVKAVAEMVDQLNKKIYEAKDGDMCAIVSIGSNFKSGSGSFRIVMFEDGTQDRYTKKGYWRGKIRASNFFKKANAALESVQDSNMVEQINKTIDKINRTKFKK